MKHVITSSLIAYFAAIPAVYAASANPETNAYNWIAERGLEDKGARLEACKSQADGSAACRVHQYTKRGTVIVHDLNCRPQSGCKTTHQFEKTY